ncbi:hypothetical protein EU527_12675 [Candidatus Thorarchaeota archaeon]|nr:MAG: hypothetical protein EU527_12675 [Candidatus Thorarchaeota archaeon]
MKVIDYKVPDGKLLKIKVEIKNSSIKSITILGDFFLHPESTIEEIEDALVGCPIDTKTMTKKVQEALDNSNSTLIGASASDIARAIERASLSE